MRGGACVNEKKTSLTGFVGKQINERLTKINTLLFCKVLEVDMNLYKADVLPLHDPDATPILDVPFGFPQTDHFVIQVPYKPGDIVYVGCVQHDIDPLMFGGGEAAKRTFDANDAVIIGGIHYFTKPLSNPHPDNVIISDKVFKNKIRIEPSGQIWMESEENINIISKKDVIVQGRNIYLN